MVAAVHRVGTLDRKACRREFMGRFTATHMAQHYVDLYQAICAEWRTGTVPVPVAPSRPPLVASLDSSSSEINALPVDECSKVTLPRRVRD
jgi:hypothetical protein